MSRPYKLNETPTAPFSLREYGPMTLTEVDKRLKGATYRTARGANPDTRATVDPKSCPHCNSLVEWSTTAKRGPKGETVRYVYARCRGHKQHRWSFGQAGEPAAPTPPALHAAMEATPVVPSPRPSVGANIMGEWIAQRVAGLEAEITKLRKIEQLAQEVTGRTVPRPTMVPPPMPSSGAPDHTPPSGFRS